jgi:hypothetical protein
MTYCSQFRCYKHVPCQEHHGRIEISHMKDDDYFRLSKKQRGNIMNYNLCSLVLYVRKMRAEQNYEGKGFAFFAELLKIPEWISGGPENTIGEQAADWILNQTKRISKSGEKKPTPDGLIVFLTSISPEIKWPIRQVNSNDTTQEKNCMLLCNLL